MTTQQLIHNQTLGFLEWIDSLVGENKVLPALVMTLETWYQRGKQRSQLGQLTPDHLDDIGISEQQARDEAGKHFWQD
ncbi:DUF1127 domain-containing protein [Solemya velum gill symbiont]|uniref:YjiS-like domain-containing protein n=1 Tax=Solemya velum gill symbiont TaxID=2340 RepID=A0A0B0H8V2_SOVGS|nr:DUF1127 domain-containing protein [Solemya velum gill symbiont]KHF25097.1 hypothetical protein JV46_05210 [Solemya velum gill symbiont]OOY34827.1 hypothetical protein BOV88_07805 [Solemya velum gill symbiont]OOY37542.1 hypothetical protein BOV89_06640 [Solemya velum gill symbiont]OOY40163.1 hypothetical protein BOV90_05490 [Solemya velum gill symbiont]OOY44840.1 hypothetical protein BOV91_00170 [Solemya velum gill symbiont]